MCLEIHVTFNENFSIQLGRQQIRSNQVSKMGYLFYGQISKVGHIFIILSSNAMNSKLQIIFY